MQMNNKLRDQFLDRYGETRVQWQPTSVAEDLVGDLSPNSIRPLIRSNTILHIPTAEPYLCKTEFSVFITDGNMFNLGNTIRTPYGNISYTYSLVANKKGIKFRNRGNMGTAFRIELYPTIDNDIQQKPVYSGWSYQGDIMVPVDQDGPMKYGIKLIRYGDSNLFTIVLGTMKPGKVIEYDTLWNNVHDFYVGLYYKDHFTDIPDGAELDFSTDSVLDPVTAIYMIGGR